MGVVEESIVPNLAAHDLDQVLFQVVSGAAADRPGAGHSRCFVCTASGGVTPAQAAGLESGP